jgi:L-lactate dehydrogenase (cytochrome)
MFRKELIVNILGVVFVIALTIFYGFQYQNRLQKASSLNISPNLPQTTVALSLTEIQKHNLVNDCWVIVSNNVYDVTSYITLHPGGTATISSFCGQDMTQAFLSQRHSSLADQQHLMMLLGPLNGQTSQKVIKNSQSNLNQQGNNVFQGGGEDD